MIGLFFMLADLSTDHAKQAQKEAKKLAECGLKAKGQASLGLVGANPYQNPPAYEKLTGGLTAAYFRRINIQHSLVYQVPEKDKAIEIFRMWPHYE